VSKKWLSGLVMSICLVGVLAVTPMLAGCGSSTPPPITTEVTYNLGVSFLPATQNPFVAKMGKSDIASMQLVYETLVLLGLDGNLTPWLAESWEFDKNTNIYTVHLDESAEWSDGTPLTAEDVKFSYEKYWEINHAQGVVLNELIESITVVDEHTVDFTLVDPLVAFTEQLQSLFIVPKHIWEDVDDVTTETNANPVGSGPYFWTQYTAGSDCIFDKNPDYWKTEVPIDHIIFQLYGSAETQLLALQNGDIDAAADLDLPTAVPALVMNPNTEVTYSELNFTQRLYLNHRFEPFNIKEFRQAINVLLNRREMTDIVLFGNGIVPQQVPLAPVVSAAAEEIKWPYEAWTQQERIDEANDILDGIPGMSAKPADPPAGWVRTYNDEPLVFDMLHSNKPVSQEGAAIVIDDLADVGVDFNADMKSATQIMNAMFRHGGAVPEGWQCAVWGTPRIPSFDKFAADWCGNPVSWSMDSTIIGWENEEIQTKLYDARYEWNETARNVLIHDAQVLMAEEQPIICMYHTITPGAHRVDKLTGWGTGGLVQFDTTIVSRYSIDGILGLSPIE